ncbi:MAG: hypothetical protein BA863_06520 [Desulfovibrio sp. S3730MH75]|nr:MAG: hypothetical protein BA863_06520 [Desulfovibrio sp. S3730MH75]
MVRYSNHGENSGVESYEISNDYITVKFIKTTRTYTYSYDSAGKDNVESLKSLAKNGKGLNSFINIHKVPYVK